MRLVKNLFMYQMVKVLQYLIGGGIEFKKGDSILIEPNEKYYWNSKYCVVSMSCTPSWTKEQHKEVEDK